jgi:sugar lactone lactonase YvrE
MTAGATLNDPNDVAVDGTGNILIADTGNDRIREVQELPAGP